MLIKRAFFLALIALIAFPCFAQNSISLEAEIQNIEKSISQRGVSAQQRHDSLVRLARLRQLSGDIEGAARNWLEAAGAIPNQVDDDALLACAYCLAAMGEWDRAIAALEPLLLKSMRARFLDTSIKAIKSGDASTLVMLAGNPEYSQMKNEIYFMLWKISPKESAEAWRSRLIAEYPQSPEGRLAAGENSSSVAVKQSPFWLFSSGLDSLPVLAAETAPRPAAATARTQTAAPAASPASAPAAAAKTQSAAPAANPAPAPAPAASSSQGSGVRLQTGVFGREANANAQIEKLRNAGFSASIEKRGEMWAVTVPAGSNTNRTIAQLREAGFESFPIR
jgi:cell division septation protein DedD